MNPSEVRETLLRYLGDHRYKDFVRDFVRVARRKGRLSFWQEEALDNAGLRLSFQECLPIFTFCHIHQVPLVQRSVPVLTDVTDSPYFVRYDRETAVEFPYAQQFVLAYESLGSVAITEVDQCDRCLQELKAYLSNSNTGPPVPGLVLTIQDVFQIPDRGTVVTGELEIGWKSATTGDEIELKMPSGQALRTHIQDMERMRGRLTRNAGILLRDKIGADQIPRGTQVFRIKDRDAV